MSDDVTVSKAKAQFHKLLRRVEAGEEVVILRGSVPVARLVPVRAGSSERRLWGDLAGEMRHDFDAPLEDFDSHQ